MAEIKTVAVIGTGTMGNGIAQTFAAFGFDVRMVDIKQEFLDRARDAIQGSLARLVKKEKLSQADADAIIGRISGNPALDSVKDADFVVEAVTENLDIKLKLHADLDALLRPDVIIGTNTSSISITKLATATKRPDRFIGMHFMNPVPLMKLCEVIRGLDTSDETTATTMELARRLEKSPVEARDYPGFVANRVLMPMINEAIFTLYEGVAGVEEIDTVCKLGLAHPMGPLQLADFIGLDVCLAILNVLFDGFKDTKFRPCPLLTKLVTAGHLGNKTNRGFYTWEANKVTGTAYKA